MNGNTDFDRIAQSWLQDGPTEMPDRSLQAALDEVHVTSQQRFGAARRVIPMNGNTWRVAAAAVIGLLIILGGITFLGGRQGGVGGPPASPTPVSPTPSPTPPPLALPPDEGTLLGGTYRAGDPFLVPLTFTAPVGFIGRLGGDYHAYVASTPSRPDLVDFSIFDQVYADPCHFEQGFVTPTPGPTVDDLVAALGAMPSIVATAPVDVTVDGYHGKQLTITSPKDFNGCAVSPDGFALWQLPLGTIYTMEPDQSYRVSIIDVAGQRLVILVGEGRDLTAQERTDAKSIFDSIQIEAPASSLSPAGASPGASPAP